MLVAPYTVYKNSVMFIRKNLYVVLPYLLFIVPNVVSEQSPIKETTVQKVIYFGGYLLIYCILEVLTIAIVYWREGVTSSSNSIWRIARRFFGIAVVLFLVSLLVYGMCSFIFAVLSVRPSSLLDFSLFGLLFYGFFVLGLRYSIFYNKPLSFESGMAGLKQLYRHFLFYLVVLLFGLIILVSPHVVLRMASWLAVFTLSPLGNLILEGGYWVQLFLNTILFSLVSVAFTYAFILKNNIKEKHVS